MSRGKGEGSVYQRSSDGRWVASWTEQDVDGAVSRQVLYAKSQAEAKRLLRDALNRVSFNQRGVASQWRCAPTQGCASVRLCRCCGRTCTSTTNARACGSPPRSPASWRTTCGAFTSKTNRRRPAHADGATAPLRGTAAATLLLEEGVPILTEGIYAHVTQRLVDEAASALERGLSGSSRMVQPALLHALLHSGGACSRARL